MYNKCVSLVLFFLSIVYPYVVLLNILDSGFKTRQNYNGLRKSPWKITRAIFMGCDCMFSFSVFDI